MGWCASGFKYLHGSNNNSITTLINDLSSKESRLIAYWPTPTGIIELPKRLNKNSITEIRLINKNEIGTYFEISDSMLINLQRGEVITIMLPESFIVDENLIIHWEKNNRLMKTEIEV